jgi:hypothetical protein
MLAAAFASLTLIGTPPVLHGAHFKPHEVVRVLVAAPSKSIRVRATAAGAFTVRLPVAPTKTRGVVVQAFGSLGSRASVGMLAPTPKPGDVSK